MEALEPMLSAHIAPGGYVACWITNSPNVREAALTAFQVWGVTLLEEWAWLKVTTTGIPVTEIAGIWRKPYEILLVGRKILGDGVEIDPGFMADRKVIIAVPDGHSRKPSIRDLIEPLMGKDKEYRALEVFARNLTTGWLAWGDEVLKFNWTGWWSPQV